MRTRGARLVVWAMAALVLWPLAAVADEGEDGGGDPQGVDARADSVSVLDGQVVIPRPTGWNIASPGEGAVAEFRSATDDRAQIEVRMSREIAEGRWERFWRAFDTDLQQAGFEVYRSRSRKRYGNRQGLVFEYDFERDGADAYRLVVWHTHEAERAWVFSAFFVETRRNAYLPVFEEMLQGVTWP